MKQQRTETLRFMSRPSEERIAERAAAYLPGWSVQAIGPLKVARTRRGSTAFDVRVTYRRPTSEPIYKVPEFDPYPVPPINAERGGRSS